MTTFYVNVLNKIHNRREFCFYLIIFDNFRTRMTFSYGVTFYHGVMVSTQDSESCDPSSNLGGTCHILKYLNQILICRYGF
jgi:hypothetical protein